MPPRGGRSACPTVPGSVVARPAQARGRRGRAALTTTTVLNAGSGRRCRCRCRGRWRCHDPRPAPAPSAGPGPGGRAARERRQWQRAADPGHWHRDDTGESVSATGSDSDGGPVRLNLPATPGPLPGPVGRCGCVLLRVELIHRTCFPASTSGDLRARMGCGIGLRVRVRAHAQKKLPGRSLHDWGLGRCAIHLAPRPGAAIVVNSRGYAEQSTR